MPERASVAVALITDRARFDFGPPSIASAPDAQELVHGQGPKGSSLAAGLQQVVTTPLLAIIGAACAGTSLRDT